MPFIPLVDILAAPDDGVPHSLLHPRQIAGAGVGQEVALAAAGHDAAAAAGDYGHKAGLAARHVLLLLPPCAARLLLLCVSAHCDDFSGLRCELSERCTFAAETGFQIYWRVEDYKCVLRTQTGTR